MVKGGYTLIDCNNLNLLGGSTPQSIAGLFAKSDEALKIGKPIIACNCIYGTGHPMSPVAVMGQREDEHTIIFTSSILQIIVTDEDSVTIASLLTPTRTTKK